MAVDPNGKPAYVNDAAMVDWKFWFDSNTRMWCIQRADGKGGLCSVLEMRIECPVRSMRSQDDRNVMLCRAELVVDGATHLTNGLVTARHALLRTLIVYDQVVNVPVVGDASTKINAPVGRT